jgi:hypothetical protein
MSDINRLRKKYGRSPDVLIDEMAPITGGSADRFGMSTGPIQEAVEEATKEAVVEKTVKDKVKEEVKPAIKEEVEKRVDRPVEAAPSRGTVIEDLDKRVLNQTPDSLDQIDDVNSFDDDMSFFFDEALYGENKEAAQKSLETIGKFLELKDKFRKNLLGDALHADIDLARSERRRGQRPSFSHSKLLLPKEDNRQAFDIETLKERRDLNKETAKDAIDFRNKKFEADIKNKAEQYKLALSRFGETRNENFKRDARVLRSSLLTLLNNRGLDNKKREEFLRILEKDVARKTGTSTITEGGVQDFPSSGSGVTAEELKKIIELKGR